MQYCPVICQKQITKYLLTNPENYGIGNLNTMGVLIMTDNLETKLLQIDQDIADAEEMLKAMKEERAVVESQIIEQWSDIGTTKTTINGRTIYIKRSLQVNPTEGREGVIQALENSGLGDYIKEDYNTNSLKSYITGLAKDLAAERGMELSTEEIIEALPPDLANSISLFEKYQVVTRKS